MACLGPEGERLCFSAAVAAPPEPELSWYHFRLWRDDGTGCFLDKTGYRSDTQFDSWQLTTYRPTHTPEWFGSGVTYHIFPDRFRRLSVPKADGLGGKPLGSRAVGRHAPVGSRIPTVRSGTGTFSAVLWQALPPSWTTWPGWA